MIWQQYIQKRGPLNDGLRLEYLFARLSAHMAQFGGDRDAVPKDFLRYYEAPEGEEIETDISAIVKLMGAKRVTNKG